MAQVFKAERPMTDDEILAGLQKMVRRTNGWCGWVGGDDGPGGDRVEGLLQAARDVLALWRVSDVLRPGLPLAACPTCAMYPDQIIGWDAEEIDASFASEGFRRTVRGLTTSVTLDCGHVLDGLLLDPWATAAVDMYKRTPAYWRAEAERIAAERDRAAERADELEGDNLELQEKYRRRLRKARQRTKALRTEVRAQRDEAALPEPTTRRWRLCADVDGRWLPSIAASDLDSHEAAEAEVIKALAAGYDRSRLRIEYRDVPAAPTPGWKTEETS